MNFKYKSLLFLTLFIFCIGSVSAEPNNIDIKNYNTDTTTQLLYFNEIQDLKDINVEIDNENTQLKEQIKKQNNKIKHLKNIINDVTKPNYYLWYATEGYDEDLEKIDSEYYESKKDKLNQDEDLAYLLQCIYNGSDKDDKKLNQTIKTLLSKITKLNEDKEQLLASNSCLLDICYRTIGRFDQLSSDYHRLLSFNEHDKDKNRELEYKIKEQNIEIQRLKKNNIYMFTKIMFKFL